MSPVKGLDALRRQHTKPLHQMIWLFTVMVFALPQQGCESCDVVSSTCDMPTTMPAWLMLAVDIRLCSQQDAHKTHWDTNPHQPAVCWNKKVVYQV